MKWFDFMQPTVCSNFGCFPMWYWCTRLRLTHSQEWYMGFSLRESFRRNAFRRVYDRYDDLYNAEVFHITNQINYITLYARLYVMYILCVRCFQHFQSSIKLKIKFKAHFNVFNIDIPFIDFFWKRRSFSLHLIRICLSASFLHTTMASIECLTIIKY